MPMGNGALGVPAEVMPPAIDFLPKQVIVQISSFYRAAAARTLPTPREPQLNWDQCQCMLHSQLLPMLS